LGRSLKNGRWWKWRLFQCQWCKIYEVQMILCSLIGHRRQWWQSKILYSDPWEDRGSDGVPICSCLCERLQKVSFST
jgi:hypothetical protein